MVRTFLQEHAEVQRGLLESHLEITRLIAEADKKAEAGGKARIQIMAESILMVDGRPQLPLS